MNLPKPVLFLFICLCLFGTLTAQDPCWNGTVAESYAGGDGTSENPFQIATAEQLALLAYETNNVIGGNGYACYILTNDICLDGDYQWDPIGYYHKNAVSKPFTGFFDGNGHEVYAMNLVNTSNDEIGGLFGFTYGATIKGVTINNSTVQGFSQAGLLVGYAMNTNISDCFVDGFVSYNLNNYSVYVGGLVGRVVMIDTNDTVYIKNCVNHAIVQSTLYPNGVLLHQAGGITASIKIFQGVLIVEHCENYGTVTCSYMSGGIVGYSKVDNASVATGIIRHCVNYSSGSVRGAAAGGIVGNAQCVVRNCVNRAMIISKYDDFITSSEAGGIVGYGKNATISNCYNRGKIRSTFQYYDDGSDAIGGIVGYLYSGACYNVYNTGQIDLSDGNHGIILGWLGDAAYCRNAYWLNNFDPSLYYVVGGGHSPENFCAFHQGKTATCWLLNEAQYGTIDLVCALNLGSHDECKWVEDTDLINIGLPLITEYVPNYSLLGTEWYYEILNENGTVTYQYLQQSEDTIINGEPIHILVKINTFYDKEQDDAITHEYIYERDNKVYWWNKTLSEFTVLYDFEAQQGDEWEIKVGTESLVMHVDTVEQYEYGGSMFKMMRVSDADDLFSGDIVCGIGHLTSFFPERLMNKGYRVEGIRCNWHDGELVFQYGYLDCDEIYAGNHVGVEESVEDQKLNVYPNPTDGIITISSSNGTEYRITNLMGQTLMTGPINSESQKINVSILPQGLYFITVGESIQKLVIK